ncbi:AI-2E family transporter [Enterovirga aerilata]|uniref:AI-2E family transporter n=1 Tax=Enterovirga aerilata TaxID=2730920 RepID=A0A849IJ61_9HYPH|nr:AI-2E family transporter [Enterovirga sp. DB1703]NNM73983.1 AI-2E family transporter [Enterovirga sp. DB1703]
MAEGFSSSSRGQVEATAPPLSGNAVTVAIGIVAALYFGREVFIPIAGAILLSFVLAVPVRLLQGWGLGHRLSVALVVVLAFAGILSVGAILVSQLTQLAGDLPRYQWTIRDKISAFKETAGGHGPLGRVADMLQDLTDEMKLPPRPKPGETGPALDKAPPERPVKVEVVETPKSPIETITAFVSPLLHPLATVALVAIFVVFILLQRNDLRNRLIRLAGSHDLQRTTAAMNDAAARLSRFFLTQVTLNACFGVVVGLGLWLIGVPSPVLWGILAAISRFIPYVGVVIAAGCPLLLAAAVDPGWSMLLLTAAFFAVIEFTVGQVVEPLLYGHSTGLSPIAVIVSVTFWTWLWGGVGLLIATPLTVCLVVLGRHVEQLEFLDVMLGDRPPLTEAEIFYQRMLAGDAGEGFEQAEMFLREHALSTYYDEVALKGLALAQLDASRGALDETRLSRVEETVCELVDELSDYEDLVPAPDAKRGEGQKPGTKRADGDAGLDETLERADERTETLPVLAEEDLAPDWRGGSAILCVAGRNQLDRAGAQMLAQLLAKHGLGARVEGPDVLATSRIAPLDTAGVRLVCVSFLDTTAPVHVRFAVRRLRRRVPDARIMVGAWGLDRDAADSLCAASRSDACATRLSEAVRYCLEAARAEPTAAADPPPARASAA